MITTFTGPMHSGKSETMIKYHNKIYNNSLAKVSAKSKSTSNWMPLKQVFL